MIIQWDNGEIDIIEYTSNDRDWLIKYINKYYPDFFKNDEIEEINIYFRKRGKKLFPMFKYDNDAIYYIDILTKDDILDLI